MNKKFIFAALFSAALAFAPTTVNAQATNAAGEPIEVTDTKGYEVQPMDPAFQTMCEDIIRLQTEDPEKSNKIFSKLLRKISRKKEALVSVGDFFLNKNLYQVANICANQLYKLDPKYMPGLMFAGQVAKARGFATGSDSFFGIAGQKYDEVLAIDPNNVPALYQNVLVYKRINPAAAKDFLKRIEEINPNDYNVQRDYGDICYNADEYKNAVEYYQKYLKLCPADKLSESAAARYSNALYSTAQFETLKGFATQMESRFPNNITFPRMKFFADVNLGEIDAAKEDVQYITENKFAEDKYIYLDYEYEAALAKMEGNDLKAIDLYKKALSIADVESERGKRQAMSGYKALSKLYQRENQIQNAIEAYEKFMELRGEKPDLQDHFMLGRMDLMATRLDSAAITPEEREIFRERGDEHFAAIEEEKPDYFKAIALRAQLHMVGNKPLTKVAEIYDRLLQQTPKDLDNSAAVAYREQACRYLVWYYVENEEVEKLKDVIAELLSIDPESQVAVNAQKWIDMQANK